jgi:hypothetical protein
MEAATKNPDDKETARNCRHILFRAASHPNLEISREPTLFITKTAIASGIRFLRQSHVLEVANRVRQWAENSDSEAMALYAQLLILEGQIKKGRSYYEKAYQNWKDGKWEVPDGRPPVVQSTELKVKYAQFIREDGEKEDGITEAEAGEIIRTAAMEEGHYGACLEVVREEEEKRSLSSTYHTCLVRMALAGDFDAAKRLGDLYQLPQNEWAMVDEAVKAEVEDPDEISVLGSIPPESYFRGDMTLSELKNKYQDSATKKIKQFQNNSNTIRQKTRYFKALDWYNYASIGGHKLAPCSGLFLALRLKLPMETFLFSERAGEIDWRELTKSVEGRYLRAIRHKPESSYPPGLDEMVRTGGTMWKQLLHSRGLAGAVHTKDMDIKTNSVDKMLLKWDRTWMRPDYYYNSAPSDLEIENGIKALNREVD